jgi:hypothetical protein
MTKTNPPSEKLTAAELRAAFETLNERLDQLEADIAAHREGLATAANQIADKPAGETIVFETTSLILSYDDSGQPVYKVKGGQYQKFGVRVWPEVLPLLMVEPGTLKPGPNPLKLRVVAIMGEHGPRKVIELSQEHNHKNP